MEQTFSIAHNLYVFSIFLLVVEQYTRFYQDTWCLLECVFDRNLIWVELNESNWLKIKLQLCIRHTFLFLLRTLKMHKNVRAFT